MGRMSPREKLAQLTSVWGTSLMNDARTSFEEGKARDVLRFGVGQISRPGGGTTLLPAEIARFNNRVQRFLLEETRLGIPALLHEECLSGWQARGATIFPQAIGLATTWDPDLAHRVARTISRQLYAVGARQGLAPVLDVAREPRWGRLEETFGEDPVLVAEMGAAFVEGLQGPDLRTAVAATLKHFAGYSFCESGLNWAPAHVPPREFREICLFPFEVAVRVSRAQAVMNAYAEVDGIPCASWRWLLTDVLREEWGFEGIVVSDYESVKELHEYHHICDSWQEAGKIALEAGIDVELPEIQSFDESLLRMIERGDVAPEALDRAVQGVLVLKYRLGLFDDPYAREEEVAASIDTHSDRALAREAASRSLVLLKNDGVLPLSRHLRRLAVIGPSADSWRNLLGDYTYPAIAEYRSVLHGNEDPVPFVEETFELPNDGVHVVSVLEGIRALLPASVEVVHAKGCTVLGRTSSGIEGAVALARDSDVAVLVVGGRSGYIHHCTSGEERDRCRLNLPGVQEELVRAVLATGTPAVLVLVGGRPYSIGEFVSGSAAILHAWLPGEEGGSAVAAALFGDTAPAGRLPVSIPREVGQIPVHYSHKPSARRSHLWGGTVEGETSPLFPFGHGLTYTRFSYSDLRVEPESVPTDGSLVVRLRVRNDGSRAGEEVAQVYVRDLVASVTRPVKELKGFRRVTLAAEEETELGFEIDTDLLAFVGRDLRWIVEPGTFQIDVGSSSEDIRLSARFELVGPLRVLVGRRAYRARHLDRAKDANGT